MSNQPKADNKPWQPQVERLPQVNPSLNTHDPDDQEAADRPIEDEIEIPPSDSLDDGGSESDDIEIQTTDDLD